MSALTVNKPGAVADEYVVYVKKSYKVTYEDGDHGKSTGGSETKKYGDTPQDNTVKASEGYKFTGQYTYVITDENGNVIKSGKTNDPKSIKVIGNIVFTPIYEGCPDCGNGGKNSGKKSSSDGSSKTGDQARPFIIGGVMLLAVIAAIVILIRRRRNAG